MITKTASILSPLKVLKALGKKPPKAPAPVKTPKAPKPKPGFNSPRTGAPKVKPRFNSPRTDAPKVKPPARPTPPPAAPKPSGLRRWAMPGLTASAGLGMAGYAASQAPPVSRPAPTTPFVRQTLGGSPFLMQNMYKYY